MSEGQRLSNVGKVGCFLDGYGPSVEMTLAERAAAYARTFPGRPPLQLVEEGGGPALYGVWVMGNDYA